MRQLINQLHHENEISDDARQRLLNWLEEREHTLFIDAADDDIIHTDHDDL